MTNAALKDLRDPNYLVRRDAAYALGWMGPLAVKAVPSLTAALHDSSDEVRAAAAGALGFIGPGALEAMGDLSGALQDGVEHVREVSAEALKRIQGTKDEAQR